MKQQIKSDVLNRLEQLAQRAYGNRRVIETHTEAERITLNEFVDLAIAEDVHSRAAQAILEQVGYARKTAEQIASRIRVIKKVPSIREKVANGNMGSKVAYEKAKTTRPDTVHKQRQRTLAEYVKLARSVGMTIEEQYEEVEQENAIYEQS